MRTLEHRYRITFKLAVVAATAAAGLTVMPGAAPAAFPGENGKIAFTSGRDGNSEVYVMDADGTNPTNLTNNAAYDGEPAWSPDGTKIAFASSRDGNVEVHVMDADGTNPTNLTNNAAYDGEPAWSPDGTKIAFTSGRDGGNWDVYVMDADGTNPTNLTNNAAYDFEAAWSPDGTKIAFTSVRDGNAEVYVMDADGTNPTNLTNNAAYDAEAAWSPDGTKIAFASNRDGNIEVHVMDADGTNPTNLTNDAAFDFDPAWSPDGTKIAFRSDRSADPNVWVMDADGSNATNLTNNVGADSAPDWQPLAPAPPPVGAPPASAPPPAASPPSPSAPADPAPPRAGAALHVRRGAVAYRGLARLYGHMGSLPGQPVTVEIGPSDQARSAQTGFSAFRQLLTGGEGGFETAFRVGTSHRYRVTGADGTSEIHEIAVRPRIATLLRGAQPQTGRKHTADAGDRLRLALRITPMKSRAIIRIERRAADGDFHATQRHVVPTSRGRANLELTIAEPGTYRIRALTHGDTRHATGRSHPHTLTIR